MMSEAALLGTQAEHSGWLRRHVLPVRQRLVRVWRTGRGRFTDVAVNEYPVVEGRIVHVAGDIEHHDSPDLNRWIEKQNCYTTAEAITASTNSPLADTPSTAGSPCNAGCG